MGASPMGGSLVTLDSGGALAAVVVSTAPALDVALSLPSALLPGAGTAGTALLSLPPAEESMVSQPHTKHNPRDSSSANQTCWDRARSAFCKCVSS